MALIPYFCCECGNRIGWTRGEASEDSAFILCEDCAREETYKEDDE